MYNSIKSGRPETAILTAHYTGLLKSIIKRRKAGETHGRKMQSMRLYCIQVQGQQEQSRQILRRLRQAHMLDDYI